MHAPQCTDHRDCWAGFRCDSAGSKQCIKCDGNGKDPDCRDPAAPAGLAATAGIEQVWLTWQAVEGAINHRVYMGYTDNVTEDDEVIGSVSGTSYLHADAEPGRTHYYRVSAINEWSEGPLSNVAFAEPLAPAAPDKPTGVAATPGDRQVVVQWDPVEGAEGYRLYWRFAAGAYGVPMDAQSPYVHTGLANGTTYYYRVSAHNAGGESPPSIEISAKPQDPADPDAPQNLTAMPGDEMVTLFWDPVAGAESYTVYWAEAPDVTTGSDSITISQPCQNAPCEYQHNGLVNDTAYYYRVGRTNPDALSLEVSATPREIVAPPSTLSAEWGNAKVTLTWGLVSGADSYDLFWDTEPGVTVTDNRILGIAATEYAHGGLSNGTTYYYRVRARVGEATSNLSSDEASATPQYQFDSQQKLTASVVEVSADFGGSVAIDGDYLVVGADGDDGGGNNAGAAYVFERSDVGEWNQHSKLTANDAGAGDAFGHSVAIGGDYLVVGAYGDGDGGNSAGAAYVFERSDVGEWNQHSKLTANDAGAGDQFGYSVAISGDYLVVGADGDDDGGDSAGAAHVFELDRDANEWTWRSKLTAEADAETYDYFGSSVAISDDYLVVGAYGAGGGFAGAAYVFKRSATSGWQPVLPKLMADEAGFGYFGSSVAISGDHLVVGAAGDDDGGSFAGAAYVFELDRDTNEWTQPTKLTADDASAGDRFGGSVAIRGDYLVAGASEDDDGGYYNAGATYVFQLDRDTNEWTQRTKLTANDAGTHDRFGYSVAISRDQLVVGAYGDYNHAGACYAF